MSITPTGSTNYQVITAGIAVVAVPPMINGGYIVNPMSSVDQGQSSHSSPADLIVDPVSTPSSSVANNTSIRLAPGQSFTLLPGSTLPVQVNSSLTGHKFTVVYW